MAGVLGSVAECIVVCRLVWLSAGLSVAAVWWQRRCGGSGGVVWRVMVECEFCGALRCWCREAGRGWTCVVQGVRLCVFVLLCCEVKCKIVEF